MFTVFAIDGRKSITRDFASFTRAFREFSRLITSPTVNFAALDHDHPECGVSSLMEYTTGGNVVFHHNAIMGWAF